MCAKFVVWMIIMTSSFRSDARTWYWAQPPRPSRQGSLQPCQAVCNVHWERRFQSDSCCRGRRWSSWRWSSRRYACRSHAQGDCRRQSWPLGRALKGLEPALNNVHTTHVYRPVVFACAVWLAHFYFYPRFLLFYYLCVSRKKEQSSSDKQKNQTCFDVWTALSLFVSLPFNALQAANDVTRWKIFDQPWWTENMLNMRVPRPTLIWHAWVCACTAKYVYMYTYQRYMKWICSVSCHHLFFLVCLCLSFFFFTE